MFNFIVCDDNKEVCHNVSNTISKTMMKNKYTYKTYVFNDYDAEFMKLMNSNIPNKIYILDIEAPSASGIDIARKIRSKDINSMLIFLTSHNELGPMLLQDELMFLAFICKFSDQGVRLESAILKALTMLGNRQTIRFEDKGAIYTIGLDSILYITHDSIERKSIIVTDESEYKINKNLTEIKKILDDRFEQTHRACLTNTKRIRMVDKKHKKIVFDNGMETDLLSSNYKKDLSVCLN